MTRLSEALAETKGSKIPQCTVGILLLRLDKNESKELVRLIDDHDNKASEIAAALAKYPNEYNVHGKPVAANAILRHRKRQAGGCSCPR